MYRFDAEQDTSENRLVEQAEFLEKRGTLDDGIWKENDGRIRTPRYADTNGHHAPGSRLAMPPFGHVQPLFSSPQRLHRTSYSSTAQQLGESPCLVGKDT